MAWRLLPLKAMAIPRNAIVSMCRRLMPAFDVVDVRALGADSTASGGETVKAVGYGIPWVITLRGPRSSERRVVLHTATANDYGHDRRADRAAEMLLSFDTMGSIPSHVAPLDVGIVADDALRSIEVPGEFYLVTEYAEGRPYADDLRRIADSGTIDDRDVERCQRLAEYLVEMHSVRGGRPAAYTRTIRDLIGSGEGIFGIVDGYPDDVPAAPRSRLAAIESRCLAWRERLHATNGRLARSHGDFHPFNILFADDGTLSLLDASRGCRGDPADDVVCLAINYVFFAFGPEARWRGCFRALWTRLWRVYLERTGDLQLLSAAPPFLAWRALVLANPQWYPHLSTQHRDALLSFVEDTLDAGCLDVDRVDGVFS